MKKQLIILGITLCTACKHDKPVVQPVLAPDAAKVIAGTYTANISRLPDVKSYPINGKTITFQVERISPDTVRVRVQAPANGFYSPARDTTYDKVHVLTKPQGYYLTLETSTVEPNNQLGSEVRNCSTSCPSYITKLGLLCISSSGLQIRSCSE